jgi:hypothetical protein
MTCIFGNDDQWASARKLSPKSFNLIAGYEKKFGLTIHRKMDVVERADRGTPYEMNPELMALAMSPIYDDDIVVPDGAEWEMPIGAYAECGGPT